MQGYLSAQDSIASTRLKEQMAQENAMKFDEQRRILEEQAKARDVQTKAYNAPQQYKTLDIPNATPVAAAPQGLVPTQPTQQLIPQAGATGLGGMTIPQQAPVGTQPTDNLGGMQPIAPVGMTQPAPAQPAAPTGVQQTTEAAPSTIMAKAQASAKTVQVAESEIQKVQRVADELHKAGLHDQANTYLDKQTALIKNVESAKKVHLENTVAMSERAASLGNSYLEALDSGADPNAAWAELLIKASADGYPIESLLTVVDPQQRKAKAEEIVSNAESTKLRAQMATAVLKAQTQADNTNKLIKSRENLSANRLRLSAASQDAIQMRHQDNMGWKDYNATKDKLKFTIDTLESERTANTSDINNVSARLAGLRAASFVLGSTEQDKKAKMAEIASVEEELENLKKHREDITSTINEYSKTAASLKAPSGKEPSPTSPVKNTPPGAPAIGTIVNDFKYKGGDPNDQNSWEKVQKRDTLKVPAANVKADRPKVDITKSSSSNELFKDPLTGEYLTKSEYRKKYGEDPGKR